MVRTAEQIRELIALIERVYKENTGYDLDRAKLKAVAEVHFDKLVSKFLMSRIEHLSIQNSTLLLEQLQEKPAAIPAKTENLVTKNEDTDVQRTRGSRPPVKRRAETGKPPTAS